MISRFLLGFGSALFLCGLPAGAFSDSDTRTQYATTYSQFRNAGVSHGAAMDKTREFLTKNGFSYDPTLSGNVSPAFRKRVKQCYETNKDPFCGLDFYP